MNLSVKKIYWMLAASLFALQSANVLNATEGLQAQPNAQSGQPTHGIDNIPSLTWPLLPGENVNGLAAMFYPHNKAMQKRFVKATMQLSRDINPGFTARTAYNQTTTIIIPELRALSLRHPKAADSNARLKMSYRLASAELEQVTPAMQAEYIYLTQRNEKMKQELTQLNERIAMQQAKVEELKKAALLWLEKQKKLEEEQAKAAAAPPVTPSPVAQASTLSSENTSQVVVTPETVQPVASVSTQTVSPPPKSYPLAQPQPETKKESDLLTTFLDYTLWVLAALVTLGAAILLWLRIRPRPQPVPHDEEEFKALPIKSFLEDEYDDDELEMEVEELASPVTHTPDIDITKTLPPILAPVPHQSIKAPTKAEHEHAAGSQEAESSVSELPAHTLNPLTISFDEMGQAVDKAKLLMAASKPNQAIDLLQHAINGQPNIALEPWLCLLDIYRTLDKKSEFLNLAKRFHHGFNVRLPQWEPEELPQDGLEDFGHVVKYLTEVWQTDKAHDYIQKLILDSRGGDRIGFSLSILEDLLMLDELLEIRADMAKNEVLA